MHDLVRDDTRRVRRRGGAARPGAVREAAGFGRCRWPPGRSARGPTRRARPSCPCGSRRGPARPTRRAFVDEDDPYAVVRDGLARRAASPRDGRSDAGEQRRRFRAGLELAARRDAGRVEPHEAKNGTGRVRADRLPVGRHRRGSSPRQRRQHVAPHTRLAAQRSHGRRMEAATTGCRTVWLAVVEQGAEVRSVRRSPVRSCRTSRGRMRSSRSAREVVRRSGRTGSRQSREPVDVSRGDCRTRARTPSGEAHLRHGSGTGVGPSAGCTISDSRSLGLEDVGSRADGRGSTFAVEARDQ